MKKFKKMAGNDLSKLKVSKLDKNQLNSVNGGGGTCCCGTSGACFQDGDNDAHLC